MLILEAVTQVTEREMLLPWLTGLSTWQDYLIKLIIPLILTFIFSGFIGLERQNMGKAAGISAHILVALSCMALAIMQRLMFDYEIAVGGAASAQGQRVIAQVVTGVGFIGAGVIMKDKFTVKGLTTAATIWTTAMIGLILGSGHLIVGTVLGVVVVLFILIRDLKRGINPFRPYKGPNHNVKKYRLVKGENKKPSVVEEPSSSKDDEEDDLPHL